MSLYLDAARPDSYSGFGTQWTDLSGNGNNATISGATYNSSNEGYFSFNNNYITSNQSMATVDPNGSATVETWVYWAGGAGLQVVYIVGEYGNVDNFGLVIWGNTLHATNTSNVYSLVGTVQSNAWSHLLIVYKSDGAYGYINGEYVGYNSSAVITSCPPIFPYTIGKFGDNSNYFSGNIGSIRVYLNKELSPTEIKQNFLLTKSRFGL